MSCGKYDFGTQNFSLFEPMPNGIAELTETGYDENLPPLARRHEAPQLYESPGLTIPESHRRHPRPEGTIFPVGMFFYNFEFIVGDDAPGTVKTPHGSIKYQLDAIVDRPGIFQRNIRANFEIPVIRVPTEPLVPDTEPIRLRRRVRDILEYDIVVKGKFFPLGSQIPVNVELKPAANFNCDRMMIYLSEKIRNEYSVGEFGDVCWGQDTLLLDHKLDGASQGLQPIFIILKCQNISIGLKSSSIQQKNQRVR